MERRVKERLTGAAILVMLGVIFIPMILDDTARRDTDIEETNIPERPEGKFDSRIVPLDEPEPQTEGPPPKPEPAPEPATTAGVPEPEEAEAEEKPATKTPEPEPGAVAGKAEPPDAGKETEAAAQKEKPETQTAAAGRERGLRAWVVQIGSFSKQENANDLVTKLRESGHPAFVEPLKKNTETIYRVRIGPELLRSDANALRDKLSKELDMDGIVLQYP